jgi:nucleotide-binding universal stress UspA family protein
MERIVFGADGSSHALAAAAFLGQLPLPAGTEVHVVCVIDPYVASVLGHGLISKASSMLEQTAAAISRPTLKVTTELRRGNADHELLTVAEALQADVVVVGFQGLTALEEFVLGSVARSVVHHAHCSVLVARPVQHDLRTVLLAHDGSAHADRAVEVAASMPLPAETVVSLIHVVPPAYPLTDLSGIPDYHLYEALEAAQNQRREQSETLLHAAAARFSEHGRKTTTEVRVGDPASAILAVADTQGVDLIVTGARGTSLIQHLLIGSVTDRLLKKASCSLLVVR